MEKVDYALPEHWKRWVLCAYVVLAPAALFALRLPVGDAKVGDVFTWLIQLAGAIGTFAAVVVALRIARERDDAEKARAYQAACIVAGGMYWKLSRAARFIADLHEEKPQYDPDPWSRNRAVLDLYQERLRDSCLNLGEYPSELIPLGNNCAERIQAALSLFDQINFRIATLRGWSPIMRNATDRPLPDLDPSVVELIIEQMREGLRAAYAHLKAAFDICIGVSHHQGLEGVGEHFLSEEELMEPIVRVR